MSFRLMDLDWDAPQYKHSYSPQDNVNILSSKLHAKIPSNLSKKIVTLVNFHRTPWAFNDI